MLVFKLTDLVLTAPVSKVTSAPFNAEELPAAVTFMGLFPSP